VNGAGAVWDYTDGFAYRKDGTGANDPAYSSSSFVPAYWHFMPNALGGGDAFETHADAAAANGNGFPFMSYKSLTPSVSQIKYPKTAVVDLVSFVEIFSKRLLPTITKDWAKLDLATLGPLYDGNHSTYGYKGAIWTP